MPTPICAIPVVEEVSGYVPAILRAIQVCVECVQRLVHVEGLGAPVKQLTEEAGATPLVGEDQDWYRVAGVQGTRAWELSQ